MSRRVDLGAVVAELRDLDMPLAGKDSLLGRYVTTAAADFSIEGHVGTRPSVEWRESKCLERSVDPVRRRLYMRLVEWTATFSLEERHVEVRFEGPWPGALTSLLKTAAQVFALQKGTALYFHGSAVKREGKAFIFLGHSGAGKTTVALESRKAGGDILNEEMTCIGGLSPGAGRLMVPSVPFRERHHSVPDPSTVPLGGIYWLEQANVDQVVPMGAPEGLRWLMHAATIGVRDPLFTRPAFDLAVALGRRAPLRLLRFRSGATFWSAIDHDLEMNDGAG